MKRNGVIGGLAVLLSAGPLAVAQPKGPPPASVVFDSARRETVEQFRPVTGELQAVRRAVLAAEEEGMVIEIKPEEGDSIKKGDVIARMRDTRAKLDVMRAEADLAFKRATVEERRAELGRTQQDLERVQTLQNMSSAAWKELEDKKAAVAITQARLQAAEADAAAADATLNWSREQLARMVIAAPFDGRIIGKRTEVGQWLRKGDGVVEVLATDQIDARLDLPERLVQRVSGMSEPVRIRVQATDTVIEGRISVLMAEADPRSRLVAARVRLQNPDGALRPGMSITGLVPSGNSEPTLTVARDAIRRDDAGEYVFFNAGGVAAVARVRTLFPVGSRVAIESSGLPPEAQVVVEGNERLFPGQPLMPAGGAPPAPPGAPSTQADAAPTPQGR